MNLRKNKGFTIIELLIVITILGFLMATFANKMINQVTMKANDAAREENLSSLRTIVGQLQSEYSVPPLTGKGRKYPEDCQKTTSDLYACLKKIRAFDTEEVLFETLADPKYGQLVGDAGEPYVYKYAASDHGFKICAYLENQASFTKLNADKEGKIKGNLADATEAIDNMFCVVSGSGVDDLVAGDVKTQEPSSL